MLKKIFFAILLLILAGLWISRLALAVWPGDPNINVPICAIPEDQDDAKMVSDGSNGVIITWQDERSGNVDIYAQRVDVDGAVLWTENGVAICTNPKKQYDTKMVSDDSGGAIITWYDYRNDDYDIYAQRVDAFGTILWTADGVTICAASGYQSYPTILSDGSGGAIIAWEDYRSGSADIYAQYVDASGAIQWPSENPSTDGMAICTALNSQVALTIASDGSGGATIAWHDNRSGNYDIYAQRMDASGAIQWPPENPSTDGLVICTASNNQIAPAIVSDSFGGAIITWKDYRNSNHDIYAQRVDAFGTIRWPTGNPSTDGVAICTASRSQEYFNIESDGSGGAIITWQDYRNSNHDIYAQCVDAFGTVQWMADGVAICTASGAQEYPTIASDGSGGAIITWQDYRNVWNQSIYAQHVKDDGTVKWTADGVAICTALGIQEYPTVVSNASGGAIITWQDKRSGNYDIYAQRVFSDGTLHGPQPNITVSPGVIYFGNVIVKKESQLTVFISNDSDVDLNVEDITVEYITSDFGASLSDILKISETSFTVAPDATHEITLTLTASTVEKIFGKLTITSNATNSPTEIFIFANADPPLGDVSGNLTVSAYDAVLILQFVVGLIDKFPAEAEDTMGSSPEYLIPLPVGDVSGDLTVSAYDASLILQFVVGLIDKFPAESMVSAPESVTQGYYEVGAPSLTVAQGQQIAVPIQINDMTGAIAGGVSLKYDGTVLKAVDAYTELNGVYWQANTDLNGEVRVAFASVPAETGSSYSEQAKTEFSHSRGQILFVVKFDVLPHTGGKTSPLILHHVQLAESLSIKKINGLVTVLPGEFRLHQNYPNPFNPETWIPYDLVADASVDITIYNVQGHRIRTLSLGIQPANSYLTKDKAAHWDGRNDTGEFVSSGVYFYHFQAGNFHATRKMILLK